MNAQRTVERGLSVLLEEDITTVTLCEAVDRVAQNASYRERDQSPQLIFQQTSVSFAPTGQIWRKAP